MLHFETEITRTPTDKDTPKDDAGNSRDSIPISLIPGTVYLFLPNQPRRTDTTKAEE